MRGDENSVGAAFLQLLDRNSAVRKAALQLISQVSAPHSQQCLSAALAMLQVTARINMICEPLDQCHVCHQSNAMLINVMSSH